MDCERCHKRLCQVADIHICHCGMVYSYKDNILTPNDTLARLKQKGILRAVFAVVFGKEEITV